MNKLAGILLTLVAVGCSSAPKATRHDFDYSDIGSLKKSFVEVVRKNYGSREDGVLSDPRFVERYEWFWTGTMQEDVNSMRFVFHYYTPVDGAPDAAPADSHDHDHGAEPSQAVDLTRYEGIERMAIRIGVRWVMERKSVTSVDDLIDIVVEEAPYGA